MGQVIPTMAWLYERMPEYYKPYVEPKKIRPTPHGYHDVREVAAALFTIVEEAQIQLRDDTLQNQPPLTKSAMGLGYHIIKEGVPIYFINESFAEDVALTEPPENFKVSDFKWPRNAMVFGFPTAFMKRYTGRDICYVYCGFLPTGTYRDPIHSVPVVDTPFDKVSVRFLVDNDRPEMTISALINVFNANEDIVGVQKYTYIDYTGSNDGKDEACLDSVTALVFKLLTIINIQPKFIEEGPMARPRQERFGRVKDELWKPNFIAPSYKVSSPKGGKHASPGFHKVRGHLNRYWTGPGRTVSEIRWLQPYWRGLGEKD
jgi:hypothetical protein